MDGGVAAGGAFPVRPVISMNICFWGERVGGKEKLDSKGEYGAGAVAKPLRDGARPRRRRPCTSIGTPGSNLCPPRRDAQQFSPKVRPKRKQNGEPQPVLPGVFIRKWSGSPRRRDHLLRVRLRADDIRWQVHLAAALAELG